MGRIPTRRGPSDKVGGGRAGTLALSLTAAGRNLLGHKVGRLQCVLTGAFPGATGTRRTLSVTVA